MARMPREPEAFGEQVAKILRRHYPERTIELAGPMDLILNGKHLGLDNLYKQTGGPNSIRSPIPTKSLTKR